MNKIPDSELEIMMAVWDMGGSVSADDLEMQLADKHWAKTTVLNFLARLVKRGFLKCEKSGRINIYTPLVSRNEYLRSASAGFFSRLHKSSLKSLVLSLYDGGAITKEDIEELEKFVSEELE